MKKVLYTLNIGNYMPELCKITLPTLRAYADRTGAEYEEIVDRKFPDWPVTYEKMQLFELAKDNDWTIFVDADTVICPDLPDLTGGIWPKHIGIHMAYDADKVLPIDRYFTKDGRNVGVVTSFMVVPKECHRIWTPLDETLSTVRERFNRVGTNYHIMDEFCVSRNLARYGIPFVGLTQFGDDQFMHLSATVEDHETLFTARDFAKSCGCP